MSSEAKKPTKEVGSVFDLPAKSLEIVKKNWQAFAVVNALGLISALPALFGNDPAKDRSYASYGNFWANGLSGGSVAFLIGVGVVALILGIIVGLFLYTMSVDLGLRSSKGESPTVSSLFDTAKKYWLRLFGLSIVMAVIIIFGFFLLIIPGLFAIYRLFFAPYFMIDRNLSIEESLKASNELVKRHPWPALHVLLLVIGLGIVTNIIGSIPNVGPLLGTIFAIAFSLVTVLRYQELKSAAAK